MMDNNEFDVSQYADNPRRYNLTEKSNPKLGIELMTPKLLGGHALTENKNLPSINSTDQQNIYEEVFENMDPSERKIKSEFESGRRKRQLETIEEEGPDSEYNNGRTEDLNFHDCVTRLLSSKEDLKDSVKQDDEDSRNRCRTHPQTSHKTATERPEEIRKSVLRMMVREMVSDDPHPHTHNEYTLNNSKHTDSQNYRLTQ